MADINVWLALNFEGHPHHKWAMDWWGHHGTKSVGFCRMTQQGFLRLSSSPSVFKTEALTIDESWEAYDNLLQDSRTTYFEEPAKIELNWREWMKGKKYTPKGWNDAYLGSFAYLMEMEMVTFDKGFQQFPGLRLKLLG